MEISHPRRILAVSKPEEGLTDLLKALTGTSPSPPDSTIAGTTHPYAIKTAYYTATIPIWLDEIHEPAIWSAEFLAPEAREVLTALGGFIVCFRKPVNEAALQDVKGLLRSVGEVVKEGCGFTWDGVCLAVAMPQSSTPYLEKGVEEWEDVCQEWGFEFVDFEVEGRNEYGGVERLKEALEANDWEGGDNLGEEVTLEDFDDDDEDAEGSVGFDIDASEMQEEMAGMKRAIYGRGTGSEDENEEGDQNLEVEKLQAMMLKMQAVRDMGTDLPEAERKRLAAKAVGEIMKTL